MGTVEWTVAGSEVTTVIIARLVEALEYEVFINIKFVAFLTNILIFI